MTKDNFPKYDYLEDAWIVRQHIQEPDYSFLSRVFDINEISIIDKIFKPHKDTLLHRLVRVINEAGLRAIADTGIDNLIEYLQFYLDQPISHSKLHTTVVEWYKIRSNYDRAQKFNEQDMLLNKLPISKYTQQIFYILFLDKNILQMFQLVLIPIIESLDANLFPQDINPNGKLKRLPYLPIWLKKGIFSRDQGHCVYCNKSLVGITTIETAHYDHIIPLAEYGSNDPTNFQLLCGKCNLSKGKKFYPPSIERISFW